jgi:hypothetical protein
MRKRFWYCRKPRRQTPWRTYGAAHLYFIAHPSESVSREEKESGIGAKADGRTRNCPELERTGKFIGRNIKRKQEGCEAEIDYGKDLRKK